MRLVMLTCEQPWQRALAARLAREHELAFVVVDQHLSAASRGRRMAAMLRDPRAFTRKLRDRMAVRSIDGRDAAICADYFARIGAPPFASSAATVLRAPEINALEVAQRIERAQPDAIVVSGTRLIRPPVLQCWCRFGMINMHTGLSPYYRGGPCTFWSLYHEEPEYAGVTIHHLSAGIDSGDVILSGRPILDASDGVALADCKVIDLGHRLMLRALLLLEQGRAPRVRQWEKGKLFLYRQFTAAARLELERKLRCGLMERCLRRLHERMPAIRTVEAE
jgi:methionyl-tRNA formyltransferase